MHRIQCGSQLKKIHNSHEDVAPLPADAAVARLTSFDGRMVEFKREFAALLVAAALVVLNSATLRPTWRQLGRHDERVEEVMC